MDGRVRLAMQYHDWKWLADYFRNGRHKSISGEDYIRNGRHNTMNRELANYIADVLDQKVKRSENRNPALATQQKYFDIAYGVREMMRNHGATRAKAEEYIMQAY